MGPKTRYRFWSKWRPEMTLEVVPLKCASGQQKTPLLVPVSAEFSSKMQLNVGKNEVPLQRSKSCQGEIGESSVHADTLFP